MALISPSIALFSLFFTISTAIAGAQDATEAEYLPPQTAKVSFGPSVVITTAVFSSIISLAILFAYLKRRHYRRFALHVANAAGQPSFDGINKAVIESLPCFRFSSLHGARDGLECAVCLANFTGEEVLRLLPRCKHAFHIACIDRWLETNASCPLCRCEVNAWDSALLASYSFSSRFLLAPQGSARELELFVERELASQDALDLRHPPTTPSNLLHLQKVKHRIVVSDIVFKGRWSALNSDVLKSLAEEIKNLEEMEEKSTLLEIKVDCAKIDRSMSEITNVSRSRQEIRNPREEEDEKSRKVWLPIARRTVECFAGGRYGRLCTVAVSGEV
ncbi:putative RING-H2 finger protein ATL12 [Curcuma longa]|uniref:putative RING-H2 finger protein ATL12 n=1 Tax=Curcuma longa TaxID=136217 RepID=UPI003D9F7446